MQDNLSQEVSSLKADNGELRAKLEESKQQLQSNEQMIRWLNQQVRLGLGCAEAGGAATVWWLGSGDPRLSKHACGLSSPCGRLRAVWMAFLCAPTRDCVPVFNTPSNCAAA